MIELLWRKGPCELDAQLRQNHLCAIYRAQSEQDITLGSFVQDGLARKEKVILIVDRKRGEEEIQRLAGMDLAVHTARHFGQLETRSSEEIYFADGSFDPATVVDGLRRMEERTRNEGWSSLRVAADMSWALSGVPAVDRLLEYEAEVSRFLAHSAMLALCQYRQDRFDATTLMGALASHARVVRGGRIWEENPFLVAPEELLSSPPVSIGRPLFEKRLRIIESYSNTLNLLREDNEKYRMIMESNPDSILITDLDGVIRMINQRAVTLLGYQWSEELLGENVFEFIAYDDLLRARRRAAHVIERGQGGNAVFTICGRNGIRLRADIYLTLLKNREGTSQSFLVSVRDISDRLQSEENLKRYHILTERARDIILYIRRDGHIMEANQAACRAYGYSKRELETLTLFDLRAPGEHIHIEDQLERASQSGFLFNTIHRRKDGSTFPVEVSSQGVMIGGEITLLSIVRDISERQRVEEETEKARKDFLFAVSHELKTPLFLLTAARERLQSLPLQERLNNFLEMDEVWDRNLDRLRLLIFNLIDSQRSQDTGLCLTPTAVDLPSLVERSVREMKILAIKKHIHLQVEVSPIPTIFLDPEAIERIFHNLMTNAIKFSPEGGKIQIRLSQDGSCAVLMISDEGPGISPKVMPDLFQPFRRAPGADQAVVPGTGLGLYVSRLLVEAHGGTIELQSQLGKGTTVLVHLPIHEDKPIHDV